MQRLFSPKTSTQHRIAAIALYRALLTRCASAPLPTEQQSSLRNAIRQKFRKSHWIRSQYQLGVLFKAGYETLDHLDAASTGCGDSTSFLTRMVSTLPANLKKPPPLRTRAAQKPAVEPDAAPPKPHIPFLERRLQTSQNITGARRVPILASANGVPFLRTTKPQPESLSRQIRMSMEKKQVMFDQKVVLENYWLPVARAEDRWDEMLERQFGAGAGGESRAEADAKWADVVDEALGENLLRHEEDIQETRTVARKMQEIVDRETEMARKEGVRVIRGRKGRAPIKTQQRMPSVRAS